MKLLTVGDSITRGTFTAEGEPCPMSVAKPNFSDILCKKLGCEILYNHGINGVSISTLAPTNVEFCISTKIDSYEDLSSDDVLVVAGGTNDHSQNVLLGTEFDEKNCSFFGALDVLFSKIKNKYLSKGVKVFAVLPVSKQHNLNGDGVSLDSFRNAIEVKAKKFAIPVIDTRKLPFYPEDESWRKEYMLDGLHPNDKAHAIYGEFLYNEIAKIIGEK